MIMVLNLTYASHLLIPWKAFTITSAKALTSLEVGIPGDVIRISGLGRY
jgi:hypothetical protein